MGMARKQSTSAKPSPAPKRVTPIVLYLALADISVYRCTESSEELLKKRRPTEVPVSPNRQPAYANRRGKTTISTLVRNPVLNPAAVDIDLCTSVAGGVGEALAIWFR